MNKYLLLGALLSACLSLFATQASAVVCAKGVYRAGCVGPNGAIVGRRGYYGYRGYRYRGVTVRGYRGPVRGRAVIRRY